jgi:N,N-dimethylformamidase
VKLTGYSDRVWTRPGETIGFHIHSESPDVEYQLMRLLHGDEDPRGPGFQEREILTCPGVRVKAGPQEIYKGSFALLETPAPLLDDNDFGIDFWLWPTLPGAAPQGLLSWRSADRPSALCVDLDESGRVSVEADGRKLLNSREPLAKRSWAHVTITGRAGRLGLSVTPRDFSPRYQTLDVAEVALDAKQPLFGPRMIIAAGDVEDFGARRAPRQVYNGKIARPLLKSRGQLRCALDFAGAPERRQLSDADRGLVALCYNRPTRAMTGPAFGVSAIEGPTHDAIHFHDDDVCDAQWPETFRFQTPADLPSGVYAMRLRSDVAEDHIPFFVAPPKGKATARLALLMPTLSYLAYANESIDATDSLRIAPRQDMGFNPEGYAYVEAHGLKSLYDLHTDGSGICLGSRRRPIIDFRPRSRCRTFGAPHQFPADLHLVHWLHARGYEVDILCDDLLHAEGAELLAPYRAVMTGTHPEYWSTPMMDARDSWLDAGGRLLYLGGNGFYWVTAVAQDEPDVIEVRRYVGTGTWRGDPGEETLALTGERGGLWLSSGRPPQARLGVGFCGQGFDRGSPYAKTDAGKSERWSWVFAGVPDDVFGAGPALVLGHGAAGYEIDRVDTAAGTPEHTVVLAVADGFTDAYQTAIERTTAIAPWHGGSDPRSGLRGDMTITLQPNGGAVFTVGSISYASTLCFNNNQSDTAKVLANVIDAFLGPGGELGAG